MFEPYATTLVAWTGMTRPLGFEMVEDENFSAILSRADGARIHFSADRAYNGLTVGIVPVSSADRISGYALWLLMEAFAGELPNDKRRPSWANQMWFFQTFYSRLLESDDGYRDRYRRLNTLEF